MIKSIQVLRAFAALSVVMFHYEFLNFRVGEFGVDIFFVISGFIISYVVNFNTTDFFKKRIARIVPLYTLATIMTTILALIKPMWFKNTVVTVVTFFKSVLYIPYKIGESGPILSLGWTLNNEMFFYLVMTACIFLINKKKYLSVACGVVILLFYVCLNLFDFDNQIYLFFKEGLLPEFVYGIVLYHLWERYSKKQNESVNLVLIGLGVLSFVFLLYTGITEEFKSVPRNISIGIPSFFISLAFLVSEKVFDSSNRINQYLMKLGDASYAMYLFHPYIIFALLRLVYPAVFGQEATSILIEVFKLIIMIIILCFASLKIYTYVDKPLTKITRKILKS